MSYSLTEFVPWLPPINSARNRHWRVKVREHEQMRIALRAIIGVPKRPASPLQKATLRLTRISCSNSSPDHDNLVESFKPLIDELVRMDVLQGDTPEHIMATYHWARVNRRHLQGVEVSIAEGIASRCPTCGSPTQGEA